MRVVKMGKYLSTRLIRPSRLIALGTRAKQEAMQCLCCCRTFLVL